MNSFISLIAIKVIKKRDGADIGLLSGQGFTPADSGKGEFFVS